MINVTLPTAVAFEMNIILYVTFIHFSRRLSGLSPFMGDNDAETFSNITRAEFDFDDDAFDAITDDAKDFIQSLLVKRKEWVALKRVQLKKKFWEMVPDANCMCGSFGSIKIISFKYKYEIYDM